MTNIIIPNPEELEQKIKAFSEQGAEHLHVLSDFDRTLTKAFVRRQKSPTVFAQIRNGKYLTPEYPSQAHELFDKYHPIEIDTSIPQEEKNTKMHEWWRAHFDLLIKCGMNKDVIEDIENFEKLRFSCSLRRVLMCFPSEK